MSAAPLAFDSERLLEDSEVDIVVNRRTSWRAFWGLPLAAGLVAACSLCGRAWASHRPDAPVAPLPRSSSFEFEQLAATHKQDTADAACTSTGENCADTKCCATDGMQCFSKDSNWAQCRYDCTPGRDPTSLDKGAWTCDKLGERTPGEAPTCSKQGEDCTKTGCCSDAGMQCFEKLEGAWSTCKPSCTPGLDLMDSDSTPWSCNALGPVAPNVAQWVYDVCAAPHASCAESGCCSTPGMQCFLHDQFYGECMEECNTEGWECTPKGYRTPIPAPPASDSQAQGPVADWVAKECSKEGDSCKKSTCCVADGMQCFAKNSTYGGCRSSCDADMPNLYDEDEKPWTCDILGPRTPGSTLEPWELRKNLSTWVASKCGAQYSTSCSESRCCQTVGDRCYEKNSKWATCMPECTPGLHEGDESGGKWSCKVLGPETHRPYPSLFCFHVLQATGPEPGLVGASMGTGAGIWECDKYSLYSTSKFTVGEGEFAIETITFEPAEVRQSKDYTAANAELFMHAWESVREQGFWKDADWTIKVDPDAVLLPNRLRKRLDPFTGKKGYIVNCAKPFMPEGPMMFGALEAISKEAMNMYMWKTEDCRNGLPWQQWGEDLYMGKCLEKLGCERLNDWHIYSDGVCRGVDCGDPDAAAFHPMKDVDSWRGCLEQTKYPHEAADDSDANAPQWFKDYMKAYR